MERQPKRNRREKKMEPCSSSLPLRVTYDGANACEQTRNQKREEKKGTRRRDRHGDTKNGRRATEKVEEEEEVEVEVEEEERGGR